MTQNELFCPYSWHHRSLHSCFWLFVSLPCQYSLWFALFSGCRLRNRYFLMLCGIGINLSTKLYRLNDFIPSCRGCDLRDTCAAHLPSCSHRFAGIDNTNIFGLVFLDVAAGFTAAIWWCFTRHCGWHREFSNFLRAFFHDVLEFLIIRINEINTM